MLADLILDIASMEVAEEETKSYYPRPSITGPERCTRQLVYWALNEKPKPLSGRAYLVFDDSSWHEELTMDWLRKSAYQVHSEQMPISIPNAFDWMPTGTWHCDRCEKMGVNPNISYTTCHGHIDWLLTDMLSRDCLIEHKALSHFGFEAIWNGEMPEDYLTQMAVYFRGLQLINPDIKEGVLLIKNKNQSAYIELMVSYESNTDTLIVYSRTRHTKETQVIDKTYKDITKNAFEKFRCIDTHRKLHTLPEREYDFNHWRCSYCPYGKACWEGWANEHNKLSTDITLEGDIVDVVRYRMELASHLSEMKKEEEALKEKIKQFLKDAQVRNGVAGDYIIDWKVSTKKKLDEELLPPLVYQQALIEVPTERLNIRKIKKESAE